MEKQIALPDSYANYDNLKKILENQGIEINRRSNIVGLNVQDIRLIDVFIIAPFLLYVSSKKELSPMVRLTLLTFGSLTMLYNANNYLINKQ
jgi:hypothetical protein